MNERTEVVGVSLETRMGATVTALQREIAREERILGLPTDRPLSDGAIVGRRVEIATLLGIVGVVAVVSIVATGSAMRLTAAGVALCFGWYALERERHLQRLARLRDDELTISLVVANELVCSGVLETDNQLLDLRLAIERSAAQLVAGLAEVLPTDCARVRLAGPSGEVPIAAERDLAPGRFAADDTAIARAALQHRHSVRRTSSHDRAVLTVPLWRYDDVVGVLELVSHPGETYLSRDAGLVDAYGRGAIAALLGSG
jgi:hypothetical protein